jgi:hypothetical protein
VRGVRSVVDDEEVAGPDAAEGGERGVCFGEVAGGVSLVLPH